MNCNGSVSFVSPHFSEPLKQEINAEVSSPGDLKWQGQHVNIANAAKTSGVGMENAHLLSRSHAQSDMWPQAHAFQQNPSSCALFFFPL